MSFNNTGIEHDQSMMLQDRRYGTRRFSLRTVFKILFLTPTEIISVIRIMRYEIKICTAGPRFQILMFLGPTMSLNSMPYLNTWCKGRFLLNQTATHCCAQARTCPTADGRKVVMGLMLPCRRHLHHSHAVKTLFVTTWHVVRSLHFRTVSRI